MRRDRLGQIWPVWPHVLSGTFRVAALALLVCMVLPAWAAEERAVKMRVAPIYPEMARRLRIGGAVTVKATVDPDGKVSDAKAVNGNRMLSTAAEEAVRKWKFVASPESTTVAVQVNFALGQ